MAGHDPERSIYYASLTLSGCIAEVFGDIGRIELAGWLIMRVTTNRPLKLLDLRGNGAMRAGTIAAIAKDHSRHFTQAWARWLYEQDQVYTRVDGLIYFNSHNDEDSLALNDRAAGCLHSHPDEMVELADPMLTVQLDLIANHLNLGR